MEQISQLMQFQTLEILLKINMEQSIYLKNLLNYSGKKAKNAQEAHEAIRPTDITRSPETVKKYLSTDQQKLYNLIWGRALSSQMETAKFDRNTITITSDDNKTICKSSGSVLKFDGFLRVFPSPSKDEDEGYYQK